MKAFALFAELLIGVAACMNGFLGKWDGATFLMLLAIYIRLGNMEDGK